MDKQREFVLQACLKQIQTSGWVAFNLADIAPQTGLTYQDIYRIFPEKMCVLTAFSEHINKQTFNQAKDLSDDDSYRDRLFTIVMSQLEVLNARKDLVRTLWDEILKDPQLILQGFSTGMKTITWLLNIAGLETSGWANLVRVKIFAIAYISVLKTWLDDETPDMIKTMAKLDRQLDRLAQLPGFF